MGDGDTGASEMGDRMGAMLIGDLSDSVGLLVWLVADEMFRDNLGLTALEASMLMVLLVILNCLGITTGFS